MEHVIFETLSNTCPNTRRKLNFLVTHWKLEDIFVPIYLNSIRDSISLAKSWFFLIALAVCVPMINRWLKKFFFFFRPTSQFYIFPFHLFHLFPRALYSWNLHTSRVTLLVSSEMPPHSTRLASNTKIDEWTNGTTSHHFVTCFTELGHYRFTFILFSSLKLFHLPLDCYGFKAMNHPRRRTTIIIET